ncbi:MULTISPECIES: outer membrane protein assembly factor BamB family protein [Haloferax]|uniref:Outer membrane protein assembly factor BamB n=1 Tax=Haloferax massiliensis TaxID=1476858 RepID=A0A0D6JNH9_9EURY|nr:MULTISPECIES: PQQ-binding-like beta-propeller repeat protein [Haloferax]MDS0241020.1 PQQ-like beta-propeller repeat protein [Haloferax sp. S2CR25]MDS0444141.1 PQQ-like beta-propeller repeat protein [Haloferax sp. S2CR25-2]CQR49404.1 Outer membrane protein assembly factor BamB [Haloferax massiliensis]
MRSRRTPPDSSSARDSAATDSAASSAVRSSSAVALSSRRDALRLLGAGAVAGLAGCLGGDGQMDDDFPEGVRFDRGWRTYAHDDANTAFLPEGVAVAEPTVEYESDFGMDSMEPVAVDGVGYTSGDPMRAFDSAAGEVLWSAQGKNWTAPVVLDGVVYSLGVTAHGPNRLVLYRARTGREFRTIELPGRPRTPPALSNDRETLFLGLGGERVCAVDIDAGEVRWTRSLFGAVRLPLAVNLGSVFVVTEGQRLYCLGADGSAYWQAPTETVEAVAPVVGEERVYIAGWDRIAALERQNGDVVWEDDGGVHRRLAFDGERLYAARGSLRALDSATGEERWRYDPRENVSAASLVADTVYVGTGQGELVALNRTDGGGPLGDRERWSLPLGRYVGHSLAATDRRVYCPVVRDDGQAQLVVVGDADASGAGTTATAGGSES